MSLNSRITHWIGCTLFFVSLVSYGGTSVKSIVIFGDSLSDIGNTTHLLKSLKQEESPAYLVRPLKQFILNKMDDFAKDYSVPDILLEEGIKKVSQFFDHGLAPIFADLVSKVRQVPVIPAKPYWNSRFSNGRVWIEYLAPMLNIDQEEKEHYNNRAFSGSWAMTYNQQVTVWNLIQHPSLTLKSLITGKLIPPSLGLTVQAYLMETKKPDPEAVYFIFSGSNDYLNALLFEDTYNPSVMSKYVDNVLDDMAVSVRKLSEAGARRFVILGIPHIGNTPIYLNTYKRDILNAAVDEHNQRLQARLADWATSYNDRHFSYIDIQSFFIKALNEPEYYGFTNVTQACIDVKVPVLGITATMPSVFSNNLVLNYAHAMEYQYKGFVEGKKNYHVCDTPQSYLFWDAVHPSTRAHGLLAHQICEEMKSQGYETHCTIPI